MQKLLVLLIASALSLGVLEALVRWLDLAPTIAPIEIGTRHGAFVLSEDPRLVYVPKPGVRDVNAYGIRGVERPIAKATGSYRIVVLGDSVAFGLCSLSQGALALEDLFTTRLERLFADAPRDVQVFNLSVSGYNTDQQIAFFEHKGLALSPDLVLVAYVLNDHIERAAELAFFEQKPEYQDARRLQRAIRRNALLHSALVRAVWYRFSGTSVEQPSAAIDDQDYERLVAEQLEPLRVLSGSAGFEVLLVVFPELSHQKNGVYMPEKRHQRVVAAARSKGFDTLDLLPGFLAAGEGDLKRLLGRCGAMHPDEFGHRVAADLIYDHVRGSIEGLDSPAE